MEFMKCNQWNGVDTIANNAISFYEISSDLNYVDEMAVCDKLLHSLGKGLINDQNNIPILQITTMHKT